MCNSRVLANIWSTIIKMLEKLLTWGIVLPTSKLRSWFSWPSYFGVETKGSVNQLRAAGIMLSPQLDCRIIRRYTNVNQCSTRAVHLRVCNRKGTITRKEVKLSVLCCLDL